MTHEKKNVHYKIDVVIYIKNKIKKIGLATYLTLSLNNVLPQAVQF